MTPAVARMDEGEWASPFAIPATDTTPSYRPRVLKHGDTFLVVDPYGDAQARDAVAEGLFHADTRYMSHLYLTVNGHRPLLLSSNVTEDNLALVIDLTNLDITHGDVTLPKDTLHIRRTKVLDEAACIEAIQVHNYGQAPAEVVLALRFRADFADIFEVRGQVRARRGTSLPAQIHGHEVSLRYDGIDDIQRMCTFRFDQLPDRLTGDAALYRFTLGAGDRRTFEVSTSCRSDRSQQIVHRSFADCWTIARHRVADHKALRADIRTSNPSFNNWLDRSAADLVMLTTDLGTGPYPYAGIPWFSTVFGRDGIITALECSMDGPATSRGALRFLAATQATKHIAASGCRARQDSARDPRWRNGASLAKCRSAATTAPSTRRRCLSCLRRAVTSSGPATTRFIAELWPNIEASASDGASSTAIATATASSNTFRKIRKGLPTRAGRTASTSIFHADGTIAEAPIALCEVQGYVYAAKQAGARLAAVLGRNALGEASRRTGGSAAGAASTTRSGARKSAPMRWRSTATSGRAACERQRRSRAVHRASPPPDRAERVAATADRASRRSRAGASAPSQPARRATIRCPTTTARSGRTTTR